MAGSKVEGGEAGWTLSDSDPSIASPTTTSASRILSSRVMPHDHTADRTAPVIVLCGTPGTGKSTTAQLLVTESPVPLKHINVGDLVKEKGLHEGYDPEWQSYTVDDDKVK